MKKITALTTAFLLASGAAIAAGPAGSNAHHPGAQRNYTEMLYDVDLATGKCSLTLVPYQSENKPSTMPVPCDEEHFKWMPAAAKKEDYVRKFGAPKKQ